MKSDNIDTQNDALAMIYLRNAFYKKRYYFALSIFILNLIIIGCLIGSIIYLLKHPTTPLYFVTDSVGRLIQDIPRKSPNMSNEEVVNWTIEALENAYSYDFINYPKQFQNAQKYYTNYGWQKYMNGLKASNNLFALKERKYVITAKVSGNPTLLTEGLLSGAYAWKFKIPLLITYMEPPYDGKSQFQNAFYMTVIVQRQSILSSYKGLGIVQSTQQSVS